MQIFYPFQKYNRIQDALKINLPDSIPAAVKWNPVYQKERLRLKCKALPVNIKFFKERIIIELLINKFCIKAFTDPLCKACFT